MKMKKNILARVTVGFRCPMNWEEMAGGGAERFCDKCRKQVTDLSALTEAEAERFVRERGGEEVCVRLLRRVDGSLVTKGCPRTAGAAAKGVRGVAVAAAAGLVLGSCGTEAPRAGDPGAGAGEKGGISEWPIPMMGAICVPEEE